MSYDINLAFLQANVEKFNTRGSIFTSPNGTRWSVADVKNDELTGYQGALVKNLNTGKYELVSRGTEPGREPIKDGTADLQMALGKVPDQVQSAREFLQTSRDNIARDGGDPSTDLGLVGPSLGGSITQILGAENPQLRAVAFNPYGVGNLVPSGDYPNITNHVMAQDPVSVLPGSKMIGTTTMYTEPGNNYGDTALTLDSHFASNFMQPEVLAQSGKVVTIDVTPSSQLPLVPIHIVNPITEINEGRLDPNTLLPKQSTDTSNNNPNHTSDYNFPNTAGAGRGSVNPDVVAPDPFTPLPSTGVEGNSYTIQSGDSLWKIGKSYGLSDSETVRFISDVQAEYKAKGLSGDVNDLKPGNTLKLPDWMNDKPSDRSSDMLDALKDAFSKADETAAQTKSQYPDTVQVADASAAAGTHTATDAGQGKPAQTETASNNGLTLQGAATSINLFNAISNAQNWDKLSDLGKLSALSGLHTATEAAGVDLPGNLGGVTGWLSLAQGVQSGNVVMTTAGVNAVSDQAVDGAVNSALGTSEIPYVSVALALQNFEANPAQSIGTLVGMYFGGPAGAIVGSFIGNAVGGALGLGSDAPPPPEGTVQFSWDANGQIQHVVTRSQTGGGDAANKVAAGVQALLEQVVAAHNAQNTDHANDLAINPYALPVVQFHGDWGGATVEIATRDGHVATQAVNSADFGQWLVQTMQETGGLAPAWQVQTIAEHVQGQRAAGVDEAEIARQAGITAIVGSQAGDAAYSVQGNATESADFKTQSYGALVVHLNSDPNVQAAQTQLTQVLKDVDNDGYFESTQSVVAVNEQFFRSAA